MRRKGHHRPIGTTTKKRFVEWHGDELPKLGDIAQYSDPGGHPDDVERAYRVIGIEEGRDTQHFKLLLERVLYDASPDTGCRTWWFIDL